MKKTVLVGIIAVLLVLAIAIVQAQVEPMLLGCRWENRIANIQLVGQQRSGNYLYPGQEINYTEFAFPMDLGYDKIELKPTTAIRYAYSGSANATVAIYVNEQIISVLSNMTVNGSIPLPINISFDNTNQIKMRNTGVGTAQVDLYKIWVFYKLKPANCLYSSP